MRCYGEAANGLMFGGIKILQSGGHTLTNATKNALGKLFKTDPYNIKIALEALKEAEGIGRNVHLKIGVDGSLIDDAGKVVGNIGDYVP